MAAMMKMGMRTGESQIDVLHKLKQFRRIELPYKRLFSEQGAHRNREDPWSSWGNAPTVYQSSLVLSNLKLQSSQVTVQGQHELHSWLHTPITTATELYHNF